ncbi:hypothetical protein F66182_606 [Fusarium sp. NRRL 66182]|nr:hypothetical protein F66182_606 [Fusarium sp. NRRL 66182]
MTSYNFSPIESPRLDLSPSSEESNHAWSPFVQGEHIDLPLLRTWDMYSGSQPNDATGNMYAREHHLPLNTFKIRKSSLQTHLVHRSRIPTPYISFTSSPVALGELANYRKDRPFRGAQTITVIDPAVRLEAGWPVLCLGDEMRHYGVSNPYKSVRDEELNSHYVCLWRVMNDEMVGHWDWNELSSKLNWYEDIILPALTKFRERRRRQREQLGVIDGGQVDELSSAIDALGLGGTSPSGGSSTSSRRDHSDGEDSGVFIENESVEGSAWEVL